MANGELPYLQRANFNMGGAGDFGGDLRDAFGALTDSVKHLQLSKSINQATDTIQQLQMQGASDNEVQKAQKQYSFALGTQLLQNGMNPSLAQNLFKAQAPQQQLPQNEAQLAFLAAKEKEQGTGSTYQNAITGYLDTKGKEQALKIKTENSDDPFKRLIKEQGVFSKFTNDIQPDSKARGALAQSVITMNKAQNLMQLIGPNTSTEELNKISPGFVAEAATALASMVKNGQVTEGEIHNFMPDTIGMKGAKLTQYLTNTPQGANVGGFMKLYLASAKRESSLSAQNISESILSKAQGNSALAKINPDRFKQEIASQLRTFTQKPIEASDIMITHDGKVTTQEQLDMDKKFSLHSKALGEAKLALQSKDASQKQKGMTFFSKLGLDPEDSVASLRSVLKTRVRAGEVP